MGRDSIESRGAVGFVGGGAVEEAVEGQAGVMAASVVKGGAVGGARRKVRTGTGRRQEETVNGTGRRREETVCGPGEAGTAKNSGDGKESNVVGGVVAGRDGTNYNAVGGM